MTSRRYLRSEETGGGRFRIEELLAAGRTHQIVRCVDTERDGRAVCAKAPLLDAHGDETAREDRRRALEFEAEVLELELDGFPEFVARLTVESEAQGSAPALVYECRPGEPVLDYVAKRPREVLEPEALLGILREVGERLGALHDEGYLFRDLDPRHVLVDDSGTFTGFAGIGNVVERGEPPIRPSSDYADAPYVAPEARQERSGETLRPAADVYGLAALLSYLLTGEEPTSAVESPLSGRAYETLEHFDRAGLKRLVAAGLQPVAKNRVPFESFLESAALHRLPTPDEEVLESGEPVKPLPPPWSGAEPPGENRAARSKLSDGPLISVPRDGPPDEAGRESGGTADVDGARSEPVREFLGERETVGGDASEEGAPGDAEEPSGDSEGEESPDVRRRADGEPAREVSMVRENLAQRGGSAPPEAGAERKELPDLSDLPLQMRLLLGVGIPLLVIGSVIALGLLGAY